MKLKFANALLIGVLMASAAVSFSSCKDTDEDLYNKLEDQYLTLGQKMDQDAAALAALKTELQNQITDLNSKNEELNNKLADLTTEMGDIQQEMNNLNQNFVDWDTYNAKIADLEAQIAQLTANIAANTAKIADLEGDIQTIKDILGEGVTGGYATVAERFNAIETMLYKYADELEALGVRVDNMEFILSDVQKRLVDAENSILSHDLKIAQLEENLIVLEAELKAAISEQVAAAKAEMIAQLEATKADLESQINEAKAELQELIDEVDAKVEALGTRVDNLETEVITLDTKVEAYKEAIDEAMAALENRVDALESRVDKVEADIAKINNRLENIDNRITNLLVQGVSNPVFGSFSLPMDVRSLMLFNFYGEITSSVTFPGNTGTGDNYGYDGALNLPANAVTETVSGTVVNDDFGTVYFTVNPTTVSLEGKTFELVNSRGESAPFELSKPVASEKLLTFGYSRAAEGTALYEAKATCIDVDAAKIQIQGDVVETLKDALKNRSISDLASVAELIYKTMNNNQSMPAYALRSSWTETVDGVDTNMEVLSNYNVMANTFKPLSFATLADLDLSNRFPALPEWERIQNKYNAVWDEVNNRLTFEFTADSIKTSFTMPELTITVSFDETSIRYEIPIYKLNYSTDPPTLYLASYEEKFIKGNDLESLAKDINKSIAASTSGFTGEVENAIKAMIEDVTGQIQNMVDDLSAQVNSKIEDVAQDIQKKGQKVLDKIEGYYNKLSSIYNRVTGFLRNPNHYLQVMMLYKADDGIHRMSNSEVVPTIFAGSGTAATLFATTYTGELLAPACKKYVAVVDVKGAPAAEVASLINAANSGAHMNEVVTGENHTFAFDFSKGRGKGYTYVILYQALDYHGMTSTQKYYVTVK